MAPRSQDVDEALALVRLLESYATFLVDDLLVDGGAPGFEELGLASDDEELYLLAYAPGATEAWILGPEREPRAAIGLDDGLLRVALLAAPPLRVALPDGGVLELPDGLPLGEPVPVQGLDLVVQTLAFGNTRDAAARLHEIARAQAASPVRARLARAAAAALERPGGVSPSESGAPGSCEAVVGWRSWCGLAQVTAVVSDPRPTPPLDDELRAALALGGRLARALGRRARGLDGEGGPRPAPLLDPALNVVRLRDPGGTTALAAALAACSLELERPIQAGLVALGGLTDDGRLRSPPRNVLALALGVVARERPGARLVLPADSVDDARALTKDVELVAASTLEEAACLALGNLAPPPSAAPSGVARLLDEAEVDERAYRREASLEKARRFLATGQGTPGERLRGLWLEGACLVHLGRPEEARDALERAWELARRLDASGDLEAHTAAFLSLAEADGFSDQYRFVDALCALERGRGHATGSPSLKAKIDAFQGFVLLHAGRSDESPALLRRAIARALPADAPRFHCWLGQALTDTGDLDGAHAAIERGQVLATEAGGPGLAANRAYLGLAAARLHLRRLSAREALQSAEAGLAIARGEPGLAVYPFSGLVHARGAAMLLLGRFEEGLAALEEARAPRPSRYLELVTGLPELERARALLEREADGLRARAALARARELVSAYGPARARFAIELARTSDPGRGAAEGLAAILRAIKY